MSQVHIIDFILTPSLRSSGSLNTCYSLSPIRPESDTRNSAGNLTRINTLLYKVNRSLGGSLKLLRRKREACCLEHTRIDSTVWRPLSQIPEVRILTDRLIEACSIPLLLIRLRIRRSERRTPRGMTLEATIRSLVSLLYDLLPIGKLT